MGGFLPRSLQYWNAHKGFCIGASSSLTKKKNSRDGNWPRHEQKGFFWGLNRIFGMKLVDESKGLTSHKFLLDRKLSFVSLGLV